jgi:glycosyltransferase involved in cell wall biosynthesis
MTNKPRFVTIFTDTQNFHLVKDVGQIPYFMYKTGNYETELVTYRNNLEYAYLENEVRGLKLSFIEDTGRFLYAEKGVLKFLRSSSKKIDILNLFHFKKDNILYLLVYKILNPKGTTYVKLDMDLEFFKGYNSFFYSNYRLKNYLLKALTQLHFKLTDLFSVETEDLREYVSNIYPELKNKLICIPNGVDDEFISGNIPLKAFEQKENIIITVGRIGTAQKNTELFLESLRISDLKDWKVYIIGPIEAAFEPYIKNYFEENPFLKDKIFFTGNITDRKELFEWYNRAKIFCLTSRFEGFPITFPEALYFGNYIISTPVSGSREITNNGQYGKVVKAEGADFATSIQECIANGFLTTGRFEAIRKFSKTNFTWPRIIAKLEDKLKENA